MGESRYVSDISRISNEKLFERRLKFFRVGADLICIVQPFLEKRGSECHVLVNENNLFSGAKVVQLVVSKRSAANGLNLSPNYFLLFEI